MVKSPLGVADMVVLIFVIGMEAEGTAVSFSSLTCPETLRWADAGRHSSTGTVSSAKIFLM